MTSYSDILAAQEAAHRGDAGALEAMLAEDFTWTSVSKSSLSSQTRSRDETIKWFEATPVTYDKTTALVETPEAVVAEEAIAVDGLGAMVAMIYYRLENGKLAEMRHVRGEAP